MQKNYLKYLISESKKFAKENKIFNIVLYGSYLKGKIEERDLDILLIFNDLSLHKRVDIAYKFKEILKKEIKNIDIKTINLYELFETDYLARQSILIEGYSLINNKPFSEKMGFIGYSLFTYTLKKLGHNKKTKFTYALIGRGGPGIIKKLNITPLYRGAFLVPVKHSTIFEDFLKNWDIDYTKKNILISEI